MSAVVVDLEQHRHLRWIAGAPRRCRITDHIATTHHLTGRAEALQWLHQQDPATLTPDQRDLVAATPHLAPRGGGVRISTALPPPSETRPLSSDADVSHGRFTTNPISRRTRRP